MKDNLCRLERANDILTILKALYNVPFQSLALKLGVQRNVISPKASIQGYYVVCSHHNARANIYLSLSATSSKILLISLSLSLCPFVPWEVPRDTSFRMYFPQTLFVYRLFLQCCVPRVGNSTGLVDTF